MRTRLPLLASASVLAACVTTSPGPASADAAAVLPSLAAAFSACDMPTLMLIYSPAVEFVAPDTPKPITGRPNLQAHLQGACTQSFRPVMKIVEQRVRLLSPTAALVLGTYSIGRSDRPADKPWSAYFVVTLSQVSGRWQVESQATVPLAGTQ
ncbi:MAG: nuclear transport factor 2 family protein [Proteobacteria bacterium]|nr:nuclear transport factor 2 family protein [Pseudomonadota bacterium]